MLVSLHGLCYLFSVCVCVGCLVRVGLVVKGRLMGDSNAQIWLGPAGSGVDDMWMP